MTRINASTATERVVLSTTSNQFDYQNQDQGGSNSPTRYSWLSAGGDDIQAIGTGMDFTDPTPDYGSVTTIEVDLSNNDSVNPDVRITDITALTGGGAISPARLGIMVDSLQLFFDELMSHDDVITGGSFNDIFYAGAGNDVLNLGAGNDDGWGGAGNDTLSGSSGNDKLYGQGGNDSLSGGTGNDTLNGGGGADTMNGGSSNDTYHVDNAGDITAEAPNDPYGGTDRVNASVSHTIGAGIENLTLTGSGNIDGFGNGIANRIDGNGGNNRLVGNGGNDILDGNAGNDSLEGGGGADVLVGDNGNDSLSGGAGNDTIGGDAGNDTINGNNGNDLLSGDGGHDSMSGGSGADRIYGHNGRDTLNGGSGDDTIGGGSGQDRMAGNGGDDVFDFDLVGESGPGARDRIDGFDNPGAVSGDVIDLSGIDAVAGGGDQAFTFLGHIQNPSPPPTAPGSLWLRNENGDTHVYANVDGDFAPEFALRIVDGAVTAADYSAADFIL